MRTKIYINAPFNGSAEIAKEVFRIESELKRTYREVETFHPIVVVADDESSFRREVARFLAEADLVVNILYFDQYEECRAVKSMAEQLLSIKTFPIEKLSRGMSIAS